MQALLTNNISLASHASFFEDAKKIGAIIPKETIIYYPFINSKTNPDPIGNQLMRHYKISLSSKKGRSYMLILKRLELITTHGEKLLSDLKKMGYRKLAIKLKRYDLYQMISP